MRTRMESLFSWLKNSCSGSCSGINRLTATGRPYAQHSSQSVNSHCINIHKHHTSQPELKNTLEAFYFFPYWESAEMLPEAAKHCPLLSANQKAFAAEEWLWYSINYHYCPLSLLCFPASHFYKMTQNHNSMLTTSRCDLALEKNLLQHESVTLIIAEFKKQNKSRTHSIEKLLQFWAHIDDIIIFLNVLRVWQISLLVTSFTVLLRRREPFLLVFVTVNVSGLWRPDLCAADKQVLVPFSLVACQCGG